MELAIKISLFCSLVLLVAIDTSESNTNEGDVVCNVSVTQKSQLCCFSYSAEVVLEDLELVCNSGGAVELDASEMSGSGIVTCENSIIGQSFIENNTTIEQLLSMNCTESDPSNCSAVNFTCTMIESGATTTSIMPTSTSVATPNPTVSPTNGGSTVLSTTIAIIRTATTVTVTTSQPTTAQTGSTVSGSKPTTSQTITMSDDLTTQTTNTSNDPTPKSTVTQTSDNSRVGSSDPMPLSLVNILWIVLGCLIALIVITLCAVILACIANCRIRRHKSKH